MRGCLVAMAFMVASGCLVPVWADRPPSPDIAAVEELYWAAIAQPDSDSVDRLETAAGDGELDVDVRAQAVALMGDLGELAPPQTERFLSGLLESQPPKSRLATAARLALWKVRVARFEDGERIQVLRDLLWKREDGLSLNRVGRWAADELCGSGIGEIDASLREAIERWNGTRLQDTAALDLCETKISLIASYDSRTRALIAALEDEDRWGGRLHGWALRSLARVSSPEAEAALLAVATDPSVRESWKTEIAVKALGVRGWDAARLRAHGVDEQAVGRWATFQRLESGGH